MRLTMTLVACAAFLPTASVSGQEPLRPADLAFFENKIRPVLVTHCYSCHAQDTKKPKGGLLLDSKAGLLQGGDSGPALVPGKPEQSLLVKALRYHDKSLRMPPRERLPEAVVADFEKWVKIGAPDPRDGKAGRRQDITLEEGRKFWAFQPVKHYAAPAVQNKAWPRTDIDRFILAKLEARGLKPVAPAAPRTLLRRVYFDLIGLPPTPEEIAAFDKAALQNPQTAVDEVVDRLLASPHFGERWGRHWLDLARYAETNGFERNVNVVWGDAWRYRDYVIDAFNADKPFDQFIREQIAGDLLPAKTPQQRDAQLIATGFLALGPKALTENKVEVFRMDNVDEQLNVISKTFLGLSVTCARCHDHKFDPIPTKDYYALAGILRSTQTLYGSGIYQGPVHADTELQAVGPDADALGGPANAYRKLLKDTGDKHSRARSLQQIMRSRAADVKLQLGKPGVDQAAKELELAKAEEKAKEADDRVVQLEGELKDLRAAPPPMPAFALAVREAAKPADCRVLVRGEIASPGETAPRGVLQVIAVKGLTPIGPNESGRRYLAEWLAHPDNPLPARVFVNRVWGHLFGRGLVATPDEFGINGEKPSHPDLLDHLAARFVADGWSVKKVVRAIVLSNVYRLGSAVVPANQKADPDNALVWRVRPRVLEVEAYRDAVLAVSGQLRREPPGASVLAKVDPLGSPTFNPYQIGGGLKPKDLELPHRSVYMPVVRQHLPELFSLFDFPLPDAPAGSRNETIVPAQTSYLLNSPWVIEQARFTAQRLLADKAATEEQRVERLYLLALARVPLAAESKRALAFLGQEDGLASKKKRNAEEVRLENWSSLCQAVLVSAEFRYRF